MEPYAILAFFVLMAGAGWLAAGRRRSHRSVRPAWTKVAKRLHGTLEPAAGDGRPRPGGSETRLFATVKGVPVAAEPFFRKDDPLAAGTCVSAAVIDPDEFELAVARRDTLETIRLVIGAEELTTGDDAFDRNFRIQSSDADLARLWLDGPTRRAMIAATTYSFRIGAGRAEARSTGLDRNDRRLVATVTAVARLARRGSDIHEAWTGLARRLGGAVEAERRRWPVIEVEADGVPIVIAVRPAKAAGDGARTELAAIPLGGVRECFAIGPALPAWTEALTPVDPLPATLGAYRARSEQPPATQGWLERQGSVVADLEPRLVAYDGQRLWMELDGIVLDRRRLQGAILAVQALASRDTQGPYR